MYVGQYVLDLYCSAAPCPSFPGKIQYVGYDRSQVRKRARREGWILGPTRELCPTCNPDFDSQPEVDDDQS